MNVTHAFGKNLIAKNNASVKEGTGGGGWVITCHMSTFHLSYFSAVQWSIGLGVKNIFLWDDVLGQHGGFFFNQIFFFAQKPLGGGGGDGSRKG